MVKRKARKEIIGVEPDEEGKIYMSSKTGGCKPGRQEAKS